ncbi:MAG: bifunctional adenosylcobinamide kinase/adenosylcobinamide-phosphate guanylyltransferase [Oscillospiraceae bacterium]|nr:bifunctional adenosylcobinamide kinase/adenosylcobinamide-phosphate guanylyltransferase [Oscillospiraceae bacterium]
MIFLFGPLWSGKRAAAREILHCDDAELARRAVWDVQELARARADLETLAEELADKDVVIATEVGGGIVPVDAAERTARERAGRLNCLLAERADTVVRVFCGIPMVIKGELP